MRMTERGEEEGKRPLADTRDRQRVGERTSRGEQKYKVRQMKPTQSSVIILHQTYSLLEDS